MKNVIFYPVKKNFANNATAPAMNSPKVLSRFKIFKKIVLTLILMACSVASFAQVNYYNVSGADLSQYTSWGTNTDGSGTNPTSFDNAGDVWYITNGTTATIAHNWEITNNTIVITNVNFTIPWSNTLTCNGTGHIDLAGTATLTITNTSSTLTLNTLSSSSTVVYNGASAQTIISRTYGNLTINNGQNNPMGGGVTVSGALTMTSGSMSLSGHTLTLNGTASGMSSSNFFTGSSTSNLTIGATASVGTLFMDQSSPGTSNNIATFTMSGSGGAAVMGNSLSVSTSLSLASGATLDMGTNQLTGAFTPSNSGTLQTEYSGALPFPASLNWGGDVSINSTTAAQTIPIGTYTNIDLANHGSNAVTLGSGTINCSGNFNVTSGSTAFTVTGNTFVYTATGGGQTVGGITYNNLTLDNNGGSTNTAGGNVTVNAILVTTANGIFDLSTYQLLGGLTTITNGGTIQTEYSGALPIPTGKTWGGTVSFNSTTAAQTIPVGTYTNLSLNNHGSNTVTLASGTINCSGNFAVTAGSTSFTTTGNNFFYTNAVGGQNVAGITYQNLTLSNTSNTDNANGNITVNGTLTTTNGGTLTMGANQLINGSSFAITNNGTISTTCTTNPAIPSGFTWTGTTGAVIFANTGGGQFIPTGSYKTLTCSNTSGTNTVVGGNLTMTGVLTTSGLGGTLDMGTNKLLSSSTITNTGTLQTESLDPTVPIPSGFTFLGTVNFNSTTGTQTIPPGTYTNITVADHGSNAVTLGSGTINCSGVFSVANTANTFTVTGNTFNYNKATGTQSVVGITYNSLTLGNTSGSQTATGAITVNGTLTTTSGGTLAMSTYQLLAGGSFAVTNAGTITTLCTANPALPTGATWSGTTGLVTFAATTGGQYIPTGTYKILTCSNTTGTNTVVGGDLTLSGLLTSNASGVAILDMGTNQIVTTSTINNTGTIKTACTTTTPFPNNMTIGGTINFYSTTGNQYIPYGIFTNITVADHGANTITFANSNTISCAAFFTVANTANTFVVTGSTFKYASGTGQTVVGIIYNNLVLGNASGTITAGGNVTVNGTLTTTSGGTLAMSTYQLLAGGSFAVTNAGTITTNCTANPAIPSGFNWSGSTGLVTFAALTGNQFIPTGTYKTLTCSNTSNTNTVVGGDLTVTGTITTSAAGGTLDMGTNQLLSATTITNTGTLKTECTTSTPIPSGKALAGTVNYAATTGSQTVVSETSYTTLTLSNTSGTSTSGGTLVVTTFNSSAGGTFDMGTYAFTNATTMTINGILQTENTSATELPAGATYGGTGTVLYDATTAAQTINNGTYNCNLSITNTFGTNTVKPIVMGSTGVFTIGAGVTASMTGGISIGATSGLVLASSSSLLTMNANVLSISCPAASFSNAGTISTTYTAAAPIAGTLTNYANTTGGTIYYIGGAAQTVTTGTYYNLNLGTAQTFTANGAITVTGQLTTLASSNFSMSTFVLTLNGAINNGGIIHIFAITGLTGSLNNYGSTGGISYENTAAQNITGGTYYDLYINSGLAFTYSVINRNLIVNDLLVVSSPSILAMGNYQLLGSFSVQNYGTISTSSTSNPAIPSGINWGAHGGTVNFAALTGGQYIPTGTYQTLTCSNTSNTNTVVGGDLTVTSLTTSAAGGTLDMGINQILSATTITNTGTLQTECTTSTPFPSGLTLAGTVNFNSTTGAQTIPTGTYTNLALNNHGSNAVTLSSGTINCSGNFAVTAGSTNFVTTGNTFNYTTLTGGQAVGGINYQILNLNNTSGTNTANGPITVNGAMTTASGGTLAMSTYQLIAGGSFAITNAGTITSSSTANPAIPSGFNWSGLTGAVTFSALTGGQYIPTGTYKTLTCSNTSGTNTVTGGDLTVTGTITTSAAGGTLDMGTNQLLSATTITNTGTLQTECTTSTPIPSGKALAGTVNYNATTGSQTVVSETSYTTLTLSNTSGTSTSGGPLSVTTLNTTAGGTFDMGSYAVTAVTTINNNGTLQTENTTATPFPAAKTYGGAGTVLYDAATSTQTIINGTYNCSLSITNTFGTNTGDAIIMGSTGVFTVGSGVTLNMAGALTIGASCGLTLGSSFSLLTMNANVLTLNCLAGSFSNAGTITTAETAATPIQGTLTNFGSTGTINYIGAAAQNVTGGTYNNLSVGNGSALIYTNTTNNLVVNGALTFAANATLAMGVFTLSAPGTISMPATASLTTTNSSSSPIPSGLTWAGLVNYTGTGAQTIVTGNYNNLTISTARVGSPVITLASGTVKVGGTLSLTATGFSYSATGNTVEYTNTAGGQSIAGLQYNNLTLDNSASSDNAAAAITVNGLLTTTSGGTFAMGANALTLNGTISNGGIISSTYTAAAPFQGSLNNFGSTGTMSYNGAAAQTVVGGTYNNLYLATAQTFTANGALTVNGTLTTNLAGTTLAMGLNQLSGGGLFAVTNTGTITSTSTANPAIPSGINWGATGTVTFAALTGNQYIPTGTYHTLTCSNTSNTNTVVGGDLTVSSLTTSAAGGTLDMGVNQIVSATAITNTGTLQTECTTSTPFPSGLTLVGTVNFNSTTGAQTIPTGTYTNLALNNHGSNAVTLSSGTINCSGNFAVTAGSTNFVTTGNTFNYTTLTGAQAVGGITYQILNLNNTSGINTANGPMTVNGAMTTTSGGTLAMAGNQLVAGGAFGITNNGAITSTSTANPAIPAGKSWSGTTGAVTFSNLTGGQYIPNGTYKTLTCQNTSGTNTVTGGDITVTTLTTSALGGTLDMGTNQLLGATTITNTGTLQTECTTTTPFPAGLTIVGIVNFNALTGGQYVPNETYTTLTLSNTSGTDNANATIASITNLNTTAGGTLDMGTYAITAGLASVTNNGIIQTENVGATPFPAGKTYGGTGTVIYDAAAAQNITYGNYTNLTIGNGSFVYTATGAANNMSVSGNLTLNANATFNLVTDPLLNGGSLNPSIASSATLETQSATNPCIPTGLTWGGTVLVNGAATAMNLPIGTYYNLTSTNTTGSRTMAAGAVTINGNLTVGSGTTTTGVFTLGGTTTVAGNVSITGTSTTNIFASGNNNMSVGGNWTVNSTTAATVFSAGTATVTFNGSGSQTISSSGGSALPNFNNLTDNNTTSALLINSNTSIAGTLSVSSGAELTPLAAVVINPSGAAGTISGSGTVQVTRTAATPDFNSQYKFTTNTLSALTVDYTANAAQNVNAYTYGTLMTSTGGTKTAQGSITVNNGLNVGGSTILDMGAANQLVAGTSPTYTVTGTLKTSVPTLTFAAPIPTGVTWGGTVDYGAAAGAQTVVTGTYNNLTLANTSGTNVTGGAITVNGVLTLGNLTLGSNNLTLGSSGSISGAGGVNYIVAPSSNTGLMIENMAANGTYAFPIGDATNYTPLSLTMSGTGYSGAYASANVTGGGEYSNNHSPTNYLKRYWTVNTSGITGQSYNATATYVAGDVNGTASLIYGGLWTGSLPWILYSAANTVAKTITVSGVSGATSVITGISGNDPVISGISPSSPTICTGSGVGLTASGSGNGPLTYTWSPNSSLSTTIGTTVTASPAVTTTYSVTITDADGLTGSSTVTVSVNPVPSSTGATNSGPVCLGASVTLYDNSSNATSWSWNGSDGYSSTTQSPSFTATATGTFTYSLTVSSVGTGCNPATVYVTTVTVNPVPLSTGATNSGPICLGGSVTLYDHSSNATSWSWTGPGYSSTTQSPALTPTVSGTYSLTLSSVGTGCSPATVYTTAVTVNPVPSSTGATNSGPVCLGASVSLYDHSSNATSWSWNGSDGYSSVTQSPSFTATATGTFTYSLTVSSVGSGCSPATVYVTTLTVNPVPSSTGATNSGPACLGGSVTLYDNSTNATSWSWTGPGYSSTTQSPALTPTVSGTYSLTVSSVGTGCSPATVYTTAVTVNPVPSSTGATNSGPVCLGASVTLHDNSSNATSWSWNGSDGYSSATQSPSFTATATGTFTYSLTVSSVGTGCSPATAYVTTVTVNPIPSSTGATNSGPACLGGSVTLYDNSSNATSWLWTGSDGYSSTTQSPTFTTTATGTFTYSLTVSSAGTGCNPATVYVTTVTVNPVPSSTGATNSGPVCLGASVTLYDHSSNATSWSWNGSDGYSSVTQSPSFTATATGTFTYSLTVSSVGTGCSPATAYVTMVTVNPDPSLTSANNSGPICTGATLNLTVSGASNVTGYLWNGPVSITGYTTSSASVPSATTSASGVYTVTVNNGTGTGCTAQYTTSATVNPLPVAAPTINGPICPGGTAILYANPSGGADIYVWTGPNLTSSTVQNPTASPTVTSTYSLTVSSGTNPGCSPVTVYTTAVTVFPLPGAAPSAAGPICLGGSSTLSSNPFGGADTYVWSGPNLSSNTRQNPTATPTVTTVYSLTVTNGSGLSGCSPSTIYTTTVTVNPVPSAAPTNSGNICNGGTVTLTANPANGANAFVWSGAGLSSNTAQNPTATPSGTTTYNLTVSSGSGSGCSPSTVYNTIVTVNSIPSATPSNNGPICLGSTATLSANPSGGANTYSWSGPGLSSSTVASPTVSPTVTTVYSLTVTNGSGLPGCSPSTVYTTTVTVNPLPAAITGTAQSCIGSTSTLANATYYGTWSSSATGVAGVVSSTGVVTGISAGTAFITYTISTGCNAVTVFTVNPSPSAVTVSGGGTYCSSATINATGGGGGTIYYQGTTSGGTSTATASASQVVTASGTYYFRALSASGCWGAQGSVTVNIPVISGISSVCLSGSNTLSQTEGSGTWSSSSTAIATIGSATGVYTGISAGTSIITFTPSSGCTLNTTVTVISSLPSISGPSTVCAGQSVTLTDLASGGVWSSSTPTIASVLTSSGIVTGVSGGMSATISYSMGSGCTVTHVVSVNAFSSISGSSFVCTGQTISLSDATGGGAWSSSASGVGSIDPTTGIVTGISAGNTIVSYIVSSGCTATSTITVNSLSSITGASSVCVGQSITLSDAIPGGTWSSSQPTIAFAGSATGIITGVAGGLSSVISYTLSSGCYSTVTVNVNSFSSIAGASSVCNGQTITLTDATPGGTWTSSDNTLALAGSSSGIITAVSAGNVNITYTVSSGCMAVYPVTVNPLSAITGPASVCNGQTITLSNSVSGGTWSSGAPTEASVGSTTGIVTGQAGGFSPTITYTLGTGCKATYVVTVNPLSAITGASLFCQGTTQTLGNVNTGGIWSSSNTAVATVGTSGIVTGIAGGTSAVSYTLPTGCSSYQVENISPVTYPTGSNFVCIGVSTLLEEASTPGTWSSSNTSIATVGSYSGLVSGVSPGTAVISYKITSTGCRVTDTITVRSSPGSVSGAASICSGSTTTYTDPTGYGTWNSENLAVATVGSLTGVVTGIANGTATITYSTGCGTDAGQVITIANSVITGSLLICNGGSTTLTDASSGGTWSSSSTAVATIGSGTGSVSGVSVGTTTISYANSGCTSVATLFVSDVPGSISGAASVCPGASSSLSNSIPYGTWSTSDITVATIGSASGLLTGVASGTCTITYSTGCGTAATQTATVNSGSSPITGAGSICNGSSVTLSESGGGTWYSSNTGVATIDMSSGILTGVGVGTTIISYSTGTGCIATATETINSPISSISGTTIVCPGTSSALTDAGGGIWSSSATGIATIGSASGILTGVSAGTTIITYSTGAGCLATTVATVNPLPSSISGSTGVCIGSTTTLTDGGSGTWSSSDVTKATVGSSSGIVTGVAVGGPYITYTLPTGCYTTVLITVNTLPSVITGTTSVCTGSSVTLSDLSFGGVWASSNTGVATLGTSGGVVTGVSAGTSVISYTVSSGCMATTVMTVNAAPLSITGTPVVCTGSTITLNDATTGGTWSIQAGYGGVASIGSSTGIVTGISSGSFNVSYSLSDGCYATLTTTVYATPFAISGILSMCQGLNTTLTDAGGGTWSSSDGTIATAGSSTGIITGVAAGNANITYTLGTGCTAISQVTVNPLPSSIGGVAMVCAGLTTTLTDAGGGTWSSSAIGNATIGSSSGIVTGILAGTANITYTLATGCIITIPVTINPLPSAISGATSVCYGLSTALSDAGGGTWLSSNTSIATVGSSSGIVTGAGTGTSLITYTLATGCQSTKIISVNPLPTTISGTMSVCVGSDNTLTDGGGGSWSSEATGIASIGSSSGIYTGVSAGTANITYTLGTGCITASQVTVNPLPSSISGTLAACIGASSTLSDAGGGSWSSSNNPVGTIDPATGIVAAISAGTTIITYTLGTGCYNTAIFTVNSLPSTVSGLLSVCQGLNTTLSDAGGGTWTSDAIGVATIGSASGIVTGISAGTADITYSLGTGCTTTSQVTVNPLPSAISGTTSACIGINPTLSDAGGGGWTSSNTAVATIDPVTGLVGTLIAGTTTITYTLGTGCITTGLFTVYPLPSSISGTTSVCQGLNTTLTDAGGGTWISDATGIASIGSSTGIVSGVSAGTADITYTLGTGCYTSSIITVNPLPSSISGTTSVCIGFGTTWSDAGGGTWSSSATGVAAIGSLSGNVTGITAGTSNITYTLSTGCIQTALFTVNPLPSSISGTLTACLGFILHAA